jgi:hypothetical protein
MAMDAGLWSPLKTPRRLKATSRRARPRWRSHQRRARRCRLQLHPAPALAQHPLLGDANNTIFISKIFSQKIWPKNWGGSSNGGFRERHVCGSGSAPPRPPFVQMKNTPGGSFPRGGFPGAAFGARDRSLSRSIGGCVFPRDGEVFRCLSLILLRNLLFPSLYP